MRTPTPISFLTLNVVRQSRWRTFVVGAALALAAGGGVTAQEATPAEECIPMEDEGGCLPTAPAEARVDLEEPSFTHPSAVTNPLFPISAQERLIQFGVDEGESLRIESSLMPETKRIDWNGQEIDAVVSQVVAYADGRILEVTYDFFAQDDEGNVWYFGEDVLNYENGEVADTDGTWLAGEDGPPGMIAPANPTVGDVFRPENIPGLVFEEVTITATGVTVRGPRGPVSGAIATSELLEDGSRETKYFAPGYGEFSALSGTEYVTVALGLPIDAAEGEAPAELSTLAHVAATIVAETPEEDWEAIEANAALLRTVWAVYRAGEVPPVLALQMDDAVEELLSAAENEDPEETRQAALDVARATLDLQLPYVGSLQADLGVLRIWIAQLGHDADADDGGGVAGDIAVMEAVWDRIDTVVPADDFNQIGAVLTELRDYADDENLAGAAGLAAELDGLLASLGIDG